MDGRENETEEGMPGISTSQPKMAKSRKLTYKKMIADAILSMRERRGSSRQAIVKYINNNYVLGRGSSTRINTMLNKMVQRRDLIQTRGSGVNGSFKINSNVVPFVSAGKRRGRSRSRRRRKGKKGKKRRRGRSRRRRRGKKARRGKRRRGARKRRGGKRRKAKRGKRRARKLRGGRRRSSAPSSIPPNMADL